MQPLPRFPYPTPCTMPRPKNKRTTRWGKITKTTSGQNAISRNCSPDTRKSNSETQRQRGRWRRKERKREWGEANWKQFIAQKGTKITLRAEAQHPFNWFSVKQCKVVEKRDTMKNNFLKRCFDLKFIKWISLPKMHSMLGFLWTAKASWVH